MYEIFFNRFCNMVCGYVDTVDCERLDKRNKVEDREEKGEAVR